MPTGDVDCDGNVDISDLTRLIDNLYVNFAPLCPARFCISSIVPTYSGDVDCDGNVDIGDVTKLIANLYLNQEPLCSIELCPANIIIDFEDVPQEMKDSGLIGVYKEVSFDTLINGVIQGWNCYVKLAIPHSGFQHLVNRWGTGEIGFAFLSDVFFRGAWFAKASQHYNVPNEYSAQRIRYHFYNSIMAEVGVSDWLTLTDTPQWFSADVVVRRVVVEHGRDVPYYNNGFPPLEAKANYFSMDDLTYLLIQ
jgi:hypothetical protein